MTGVTRRIARALRRPISPSEFSSQLQKICLPREKFGICVSGGPDSMALALLFQKLRDKDPQLPLDFKAFIIDHAHRHDSRDEAVRVSSALEKLGIDARIISAEWPSTRYARSSGDFETRARVLRYRTLARACADDGVQHLFLGHHRGDQAETILFRLISSQTPSLAGLAAMKPVSHIPHCGDIFGGGDSCRASTLSDIRHSAASNTSNHDGRSRLSAAEKADESGILIARPGIQLYRPLLDFPKSRLIDTCKVNKVRFVVDKSNFDCKLTKRNTIRWLLQNAKLPRALQEESIVRLSATAAAQDEIRQQKVEKMLAATHLESFDPRSGMLRISTPRNFPFLHDAGERDTARWLFELLQVVVPTSDASLTLQRMGVVVRWMFPSLPGSSSVPFYSTGSTTWAGHGVHIVCGKSGEMWTWRLSRQPLRAFEAPEARFTPAQDSESSSTSQDIWSKWTKWDGRYWIRICTRRPQDIDSLSVHALDPFRLRKWASRSKYKELLHDAAPGGIRFTLPVIVKGQQPRALPTLNLGRLSGPENKNIYQMFHAKYNKAYSMIRDDEEERAYNKVHDNELGWEVRYKDVTKTLRLLGTTKKG